jgi:hypothetical protein
MRLVRTTAAALAAQLLIFGAIVAAQPAKPPVIWEPAAPGNYEATNGRAISMIVIHKAEGYDAAAYFANPAAGVSAHYSVLESGAIHQSVADKDIAYHAGNWPYNVMSIGIEHDGFAAQADTTDAEYNASAQLVASLCATYGIPIDRQHIIGHNEVPDPNHPGEFGGVDHHTCPGPNWDWNRYMALVRAASGGQGPSGPPPGAAIALAPTPDGGGYWIATNDGGVFSYGNAQFHGSAAPYRPAAPIVGIAATPDGGGYWLAASDGGIFSFGNARFFGSLGGVHLNAPIVGIAGAPGGDGYTLVASDGGIFAFGGAHFFGSLGGVPLNAPVTGIALTKGGGGYTLVAADGGTFDFGDARFYGSLGGVHLNAPVVGIARTPGGNGYILVGSDGGIFCFGDAVFAGSAGSLHLNAPVAAIAKAASGNGYWLVGWDGGIFSYGGAGFFGSKA